MKIKTMIYYALFAALTGVLSQIMVPLPFTPVPVNLALVSVLISAGLLGGQGGSASQLLYVLLGAVGVPVFAKFGGGLGVLTGPTGGYIIGYVFAAYVAGQLIAKSKKNVLLIGLSMALGVIVCYAFGTAYFMFSTKKAFVAALGLCVTPFIPADLLKIVLSAMVVSKFKDTKLWKTR